MSIFWISVRENERERERERGGGGVGDTQRDVAAEEESETNRPTDNHTDRLGIETREEHKEV